MPTPRHPVRRPPGIHPATKRRGKFHITLRYPREARITVNRDWWHLIRRTPEHEYRFGTGDRGQQNWRYRLRWDIALDEATSSIVLNHAYSRRHRGYRRPNRFRYYAPR